MEMRMIQKGMIESLEPRGYAKDIWEEILKICVFGHFPRTSSEGRNLVIYYDLEVWKPPASKPYDAMFCIREFHSGWKWIELDL